MDDFFLVFSVFHFRKRRKQPHKTFTWFYPSVAEKSGLKVTLSGPIYRISTVILSDKKLWRKRFRKICRKKILFLTFVLVSDSDYYHIAFICCSFPSTVDEQKCCWRFLLMASGYFTSKHFDPFLARKLLENYKSVILMTVINFAVWMDKSCFADMLSLFFHSGVKTS